MNTEGPNRTALQHSTRNRQICITNKLLSNGSNTSQIQLLPSKSKKRLRRRSPRDDKAFVFKIPLISDKLNGPSKTNCNEAMRNHHQISQPEAVNSTRRKICSQRKQTISTFREGPIPQININVARHILVYEAACYYYSYVKPFTSVQRFVNSIIEQESTSMP